MFNKLRQQQSGQKTQPNSTRDRFLSTLERFEKAKEWFKEQARLKKSYHHMIPKFRSLERSVDYLWNRLPEATREAILEEMISRGELPADIIQIIKDFEGRLIWI